MYGNWGLIKSLLFNNFYEYKNRIEIKSSNDIEDD